MLDSNRSEKFSSIGVILAEVLGLYLSSHSSYLPFHSLVEFIIIAVAFTIFILIWNTRRYLANNYLRLFGIGYAFIALIDLLHKIELERMNKLFVGRELRMIELKDRIRELESK